MNKLELARGRNWQKARLTGSVIDKRFLTKAEIEIVNEIGRLKTKLLRSWDFNSEQLGLNVERFDLTVKVVNGEFFKHNITRQEVLMYTHGVNKKDYIIKKCK